MRIRQADHEQRWRALKDEMRGITEDHIEPIKRWAQERREPYVVRPIGGEDTM